MTPAGGDAASQTPSAEGSRMPALDGLRGLAILAVIPHNTNVFGAKGLFRIFTFTLGAGWIGVQLFFVLSGFLITLALLDSLKSPDYYRAFYARRTLRIFPLYYSTLAVLLLVLPAMGYPVIEKSENQLWLWLYVSNWTDPFGLNVPALGHFWSLGVEEQFYLTWPFLVMIFSRRLLGLCLTVASVALVCRIALLLAGVSKDAVYLFTICRMDALAAGAAAAVLFRTPAWHARIAGSSGRLFRTGLILLLLGAPLTGFYANRGLASLSFGFTLLSVAFAMLVLAAAAPGRAWWRTVLEMSLLRSVGKYSYAMYVFHLPVDLIWREPIVATLTFTGGFRPVAYMIVITVLSYAAAWISYHVLEKHFLQLKRHFVPRPASSP